MRKLKMHSITELVLYAVKNRIIMVADVLNKPRKAAAGVGASA